MLSLIILTVIVVFALVLFIGGWLSVDLVGLLVLSALALTGLVTGTQALAGFSSPAVVTVWAMFILSAGLTRTGVAQQLGQPLQRFTKGSEAVLVIALMVAASLLSALINTITVAAILLPTAMELARRSGRPPARLLMPLSLGCLLGGPFTGISTPPNILVTDALRTAGLTPFAIFDFTPITAAIVVSGIIFTVLIGLRLLPKRSTEAAVDKHAAIEDSYQLSTHLFTTQIRPGSLLAGRTIAESRLGSALYLTVVALQRKGALILAPRPNEILQVYDTLVVHGPSEHLAHFNGSNHLQIESADKIDPEVFRRLVMAEGRIGEGSPLEGKTLAESSLRKTYRVHVPALPPAPECHTMAIPHCRRFSQEDTLLLQGKREDLEEIARQGLVTDLRFLAPDQFQPGAGEQVSLLPVHVPPGSVLTGHNLIESRLGNAFGLTVVAIVRDQQTLFMPVPQEQIRAGDLLILQGSKHDLDVLKELQQLEIKEQSLSLAAELESQQIGVTEVLLSPRTTLAGRTLADLLFREHYGLNVLAIWRKGTAHREGLQDMPLQFGDALLVYGQRQNLEAVARDPNFLVLDQVAAKAPRLDKAPVAVAIMVAVLLSAILGYVPIAIAGLTGAALMVLFGCLSMEEAYRAIEWKVVFLIASMLPLGVAVENTGAAQMGAEALLSVVGDLGPRWVVAALFLVTVIGTQVIPTAALVVLMAPVALSSSEALGISPHLLMMTVAMAASASYASPLSHPAHLLVMGPGGYRFVDYVKVGVPLTIVVMAVSVWLLPILWPA
jgi:di/tricarboxylate transporter